MAAVHGEPALRALERAVRDALPAWSLSPITHVERLNISENATFYLDDPRNARRLVVRVHRPGYHIAAEIRSELAWITALREQAVVTTPAPSPGVNGEFIQALHLGAESPSPIPSSEGRGEDSLLLPLREGAGGRGIHRPAPLDHLHAVAFEYVAGRAPAHTDDLTGTFRMLGAITARLHIHARAWKRPPGFVRKPWEFRTMLGDRALWGDWRAGPGLDSAGTALLQRAIEHVQIRLVRFGTASDRFGLIHADLRLTNLLIDGNALNLIDFDDCGFGWFAYDFAASVSFIEDDPAVPELLNAWLDGYRTVAPFAREDEAEIPTFVMLRRLLLLAWIASHAETPTAQALRGTYTDGTLALADDFLRRYG